MVTANELLKSITNSEAEGHIVIGIDRHIIVPKALKRIAVQYDHNVETVTFDCPRYWDELDMSKMAIYVNYMRSDGYADRYPVSSVTVDNTDSNIMHFDWTISRNVTEVAGTISFLVCIKKTDSEGNEVNHWNSELCQDLSVSIGMETEEQVMDLSSDLVTQLLLRMDSVEQINIQASEMQTLYENTQAVATTAEQVKNEALDASNYIKNSYANAIKGKLSGASVFADDVSPIQHNPVVFVHGKNLIPSSFYDMSKWDVIEGTVNNFVFPLPHLRDGVTYTISANVVDISSGYFYLEKSANGFVTDIDIHLHTPNNNFLPFTFEKEEGYEYRLFWYDDPNVVTDFATNFQLEEGMIATEYEPWIDPSTVTLKRCNKSVFSANQYELKTASPYAWSSILMAKIQVPHGIYTASCRFRQKGNKSRVALSMREYEDQMKTLKHVDSQANEGTLSATFEVKDHNNGFCMFLYSNYSADVLSTDCMFYDIMVEYGGEATAYQPYDATVHTPKPDGTVSDITSLSPNILIYANNPGVTIEAEYNRDTTKAMTSYIFTEEIKDEIAAKVEDNMAEVLASLNSYAASVISGGDS